MTVHVASQKCKIIEDPGLVPANLNINYQNKIRIPTIKVRIRTF